MVNLNQLVAAEKQHWQHLEHTVIQWAKANVPDLYNYSSRAHYWGSACQAGIITKDDLDLAYHIYGDMIDYTGD